MEYVRLLDKRQFLKYYIFVSLIVYLETILFPRFIISWIYRTDIQKIENFKFVDPNLHLVLFFIISFLIFRKSAFYLHKKPDIIYFLLHLSLLLLFTVYLVYVMSFFSFPPLDKNNLLVKFARLFLKDFTYFSARFKFLYLLFSVCCHYTLLFAVLQHKKAFYEFFFSLSLGFLAPALYLESSYVLWKLLGYGTTRIVFILLRLSGLNAFFYTADSYPIVGTDMFKVGIGLPCSGIEGQAAFIIAFIIMLLLNWGRIDNRKAAAVVYIGIFTMYITNILRIYLLVLIGHFLDRELIYKFFHSWGSMFLYALVIIIILKASFRWLTAPSKK